MSAAKKVTLYIDVDDEITTIIDKVTNSKEKIVALVLPKRAAVMQSIINMKLLKRSAEEEKKKIVLITSDTSVMPLAGIAGVHVAKTLQSKPVIPEAPVENAEVDNNDAEDVELDKTQSIAALTKNNEEEVAEVPEPKSSEADKKSKKPSTKKDKKLKIPNFSKFRTKLFLAVLVLFVLLGGWIVASRVLPNAEIVIKTDTKTFSKDINAVASLTAQPEKDELPARLEIIKKDGSQTVEATGEKNVGKKAEGRITLTNCIDDGESHTIPRGTGFTKDGKTFVTTERITLAQSYTPDGECLGIDGFNKKNVDVIASEGGSSYNIDSGAHNSSIAGINAYGSKMTGGTDDIKKVVSQADIDKAKQQLEAELSNGVVEELKARFTSQGYVPFESTFKPQDENITESESADSVASSVTVSGSTTFAMVGVNKEAIESKIKNDSQEDIDNSAQTISDTGIDSATMRISESGDGVYNLSIQSTVTAGPQLDSEALKKEILGKRYSETESILSGKAGVVDVDIKYGPFWVNSTPNNADKVSITVENIAAEDE